MNETLDDPYPKKMRPETQPGAFSKDFALPDNGPTTNIPLNHQVVKNSIPPKSSHNFSSEVDDPSVTPATSSERDDKPKKGKSAPPNRRGQPASSKALRLMNILRIHLLQKIIPSNRSPTQL